jgi:hypothetical protein
MGMSQRLFPNAPWPVYRARGFGETAGLREEVSFSAAC